MMKKNSAFTLIEMLVVVIILGVILAIAIPSVSNIVNQNKNTMYQTYMTIVEEKMNLFIDSHKGELTSLDATCFQVDYQTLLENHFLTEGDITCSGSIIITKSGNGKNFSSDYYLSCKDKNDNYLHKSGTVPTGCTLFSGK